MPDLKLTPQEQNIVQYHRNNIKMNHVGRDEEGHPVTVWSTGVQMESGPHKGKYVSVPGYIAGQKIDDPELVRDYWRSEINQGKWPVYSSSKELNKRSKEIHSIMDDEVPEAMSAGKAEGFKKGGVIRGHGIETRGRTKGRIV